MAKKNLSSLDTLDILMRRLFIARYENAKDTIAELIKKYSNKAEMLLHFHPQAGNALSLIYGNHFLR